MAQLKRAEDEHFYIRVSPGEGTWQIDEKGISWLRSRGYPIPTQGKGVSIGAGTYRRLKDEGYLDTRHISYEPHNVLVQPENEIESRGLPLFLQLQEEQNPHWILSVELSELVEDEKVRAELKRHRATLVTMKCVLSSLPQKHLYNASCLLKVRPQTQQYLVQWQDAQGKESTLQAAPKTPGLIDNWQGNVFVVSKQKVGLWRRLLPNSTVSFGGIVLWLAKVGCQPEWPGKVSTIGQPEREWQLWQLEVNDSLPVAWEKVEQWFSYRSIDIVPQHQRLQIISPPEAITDDSWFISRPGQPLLIQCNPPCCQVEGVSKHIYLSASTVNSSASQSKKPLQALSGAFLADKVSYFHWQALHSDRYHISLKGDATAEPLLIRVDSLSTAQPQWFYGLCCTVASVQAQQTFCAFKDIDPPGEKDVLNRFSQQELPALTWTFEPAGLPIHVSWKHASGQGDRINSIWSGEELTEHWQKRIWPTIAASTEANLTLDAGSFGLIELSLTPIVIREEDLAWWTDERLLAQFIWLSRVATRRHDQAQIAVPVSLREAISQLRTQSIEYPLLYTALDRLARINVMPCWVLYRMRTLMTEIQKKQTGMKHRADKVKTMNYN